ncbi:MAG: hypothetical protein LUH12_01005 [Bacteroides sp.]|nr:hypothetical protein [Bacteroides sp.]
MGNSNESDLLAKYQSSLQYQNAKNVLNLQKEYFSYGQKLEFESNLQAIKLHYKNYMALMDSTIYADSNGNLIYAITEPDGKTIRSKKLLSAQDYQTHIFVSFYPKLYSVLEVSWALQNSMKSIYFPYGSDGIAANIFLRRLKSNGLMLLVSGRTQRDAADKLLAYSFITADERELPYTSGWNRMKNGGWHFADDKELTMRIILEMENGR